MEWPWSAIAASSSSCFSASPNSCLSVIKRTNSSFANRYLSNSSARSLRHSRFDSKHNLVLISKRRINGDSVVRRSTTSNKSTEEETEPPSSSSVDCVGMGSDVECVYNNGEDEEDRSSGILSGGEGSFLEWTVLISPFFFWGTAMVAMKEVLPITGPFFVAAFRLIPAGLLLVAFAVYKGRPLPKGLNAWFSIALFALVDATCFQGFLAQGLQRTSAGLGSVIIDSQPLTVAVLASFLFGESIGIVRAGGLLLGVAGLLLLEVPSVTSDGTNFSLWGSGEWWMLLAAQSMAIGTVMVRWVSKYSDPIMATGWHMVIGGLPLLAVSVINHDPVFSGSLQDLSTNDVIALLYTSIFGSAVSYGVYFYSATKGSLTKLSSLTFLTPMFASIFGYLYLDETFSSLQLVGAAVTLVAIYLVNFPEGND
ncbi:PREDICTED: WAT1-related protein At3g02690, chloroplastic [Camelina sativa]|uniref:WAT1-related protein At3g02690, chloroplastic n=1 Tax=Camelina sativa TaxID=90675 RepID=A0ABM0VZR1_CAMSA|nr:PREDICTED: WAT1-related protein At3g02690, chloroplastic [Camelina sativa]